jgi:glutamyl-tRNA synthetase
VKKAESLNGDHIRLLTPEVFLERCVPYLQEASLVANPVTEGEASTLAEILPFVQERVGLLGEVPSMIAFLFTADDALVIEDDARKTLGDRSAEVLDAALLALEALEPWDTASLEDVLRAALVERLEVSPRHAFGPLRVAISGRRVSPPLFESMEVLGRNSSLQRLRALRQSL